LPAAINSNFPALACPLSNTSTRCVPAWCLRVGVSTVDIVLLNAHSQRFQTKRDLVGARYNVLIGGLKLRQANGTLTPQNLLLLNSLLVQ
jgi:outer membrane protein